MSGVARVSLLALMLPVLLGLPGCSDRAAGASLRVEARRDLFLDQEHVELVAGFGEYRELATEHDPLLNPDRNEVALPLFRNGTLVWHCRARPGRFLTAVCRLGVGAAADASPAELRVTALADGEPLPGCAGVWQVPALPADPHADPDAWHEGPALPVELELPQGAEALRLELVSPLPIPPGANLALLSPRVDMAPREVRLSDWPLRFEQAQRLATRVTGEPALRTWSELRRQLQQDGQTVEHIGPMSLPEWSAEGSFRGHDARMALAVLGGSELSIPLPVIGEDSALVAELALDERLPQGSEALLVLSVDGVELARRSVDSSFWAPLRIDLGARPELRGAGHTLSLSVQTKRLPHEWVARSLPNFGKGVYESVGWRADTVALGLADLRVERERQRSRHLASSERPSLVLIQVETLRADVLEQRDAQGRLIAPHLASLARAGRYHSMAMAPSPWTVPSTATLFTGLPPGAHGAASHHSAAIVDAVTTLAEKVREAGVPAAAVVTNDLLGPHAGWARGFAPYAHVPYANAAMVTDLARSLLGRFAGSQQLLFLHYWDPHGPYNAPGAWRRHYVPPELADRDGQAAERRATAQLLAGAELAPDDPDLRLLRALYLGEVAYLDEQIGALLGHLIDSGLADTTVVVLSADHGEEFFEHGMWGHGSQLFDESVAVPLVIARAGRWAESYQAALAADGSGPIPSDAQVLSTEGLHAEVLSLLGVPYDPDEVLPRLSAGAGPACTETEKGVVRGGPPDEDPLQRHLEAVRGQQGLLLARWPVASEVASGAWSEAPRWSFYDLVADPGARQPLPADGPAAAALRRVLEQRRAFTDEHRLQRLRADLDLAALAQMGYLGGRGR